MCARSEANDLALEICRVLTKGSEILVLDGAYHGHTKSLLSLSSYKVRQQADPSSSVLKLHPNAWMVRTYSYSAGAMVKINSVASGVCMCFHGLRKLAQTILNSVLSQTPTVAGIRARTVATSMPGRWKKY